MVYELDTGWPGLSVKQELLSEHAGSIPVVHPKCPCGEMVNTPGLKLGAQACWFESSQGYNWSYSLIGKTYRYERYNKGSIPFKTSTALIA